ncbi:MAG: PEP-CTERM sorting domain-containing protein [Fimbriimonadaceae bacterium]|nr:PEP-CTERM sorting domain-containing protein [Fimbriimonadaceae bacterium]
MTSVNDLILHITTDPEVFSRYSRHFAMDREELIAYIGTLHRAVLDKDGLYVVYNVPATGELRSKARMLKKGTPVFADPHGTAVMMVICGNPMTRGPKKETTIVEFIEPNTTISTEIAEVPVTMQSELSEAVASVIPPGYNPVETIPSAVYTPPTVTGGGSDIQIIGGGGFPWAILPALGLVGAVGGGGSNPPVPEPATIAILAAGVTTLVVRRRKRSS